MVKSPDVIARMRVAGRIAAEVLAVTGAAVSPGGDDRGARPDRPPGLHRAGRLSLHPQLPRLPEVDLHLGQRGDLPRHPRRPPAGGRRHRQYRRHRLYRRCARRLQRHLRRRRGRSRIAGAGRGHPGVPGPGHRRGPTRVGRISDIGRAIEAHASAHGYGVVRMFVGHGIGEQFHISPSVPHYYTAGRRPRSCSPG